MIRVLPCESVAKYAGSPAIDANSRSLTFSPASCASAARGSFAAKASSGARPCSAWKIRGPFLSPLPSRCGNGSIESIPLSAHVTAPMPTMRPAIMCQRFQQPGYGIDEVTPAYRYRFDGEYIQTPIIRPSNAANVAIPDDQMTTLLQSGPFRRSGVKYSQCGIAPKYAPMREAVVVYWMTSPFASDT